MTARSLILVTIKQDNNFRLVPASDLIEQPIVQHDEAGKLKQRAVVGRWVFVESSAKVHVIYTPVTTINHMWCVSCVKKLQHLQN